MIILKKREEAAVLVELNVESLSLMFSLIGCHFL